MSDLNSPHQLRTLLNRQGFFASDEALFTTTGYVRRRLIDPGIDRLYLYTSKAKALYESLGWVVIGSDYYEGEDVTIMCKSSI